jgi:hypothetical protein
LRLGRPVRGSLSIFYRNSREVKQNGAHAEL